MIFFKLLRKGAASAASSYRLLISIWLITLMMVILVALPLKGSLNSIFGKSMAVERLSDGFDLGLTGDMGERFGQLVMSATSGGFLLIVAGILLYTFFTGGLFTQFTTSYGSLNQAAFFRTAAQNFTPFLLTGLLMAFIIGAYSFLLLGIPAGVRLMMAKGSMPEGNIMVYLLIVWALGMPVWLLVADYSRRWIAATGSRRVFRAVGEGFSMLRKRFWMSYFVMAFILLLNVVFAVASLGYAAWSVPEKGMMILLFFIATQVLFIFRLFMKAWRFATVCEMAVR